MAKNNRKPIPKSQKELSNGLITPYDPRVGNPNGADKYSVNPDINQANIPFNRSEKLSQKGDTYKQFSVGLEDIDESLFYYFNEVIQPFVYQNGERRTVPLVYANPERWAQMQKGAFYRDKSGAIMMPIMVVKRDSFTRNRNLPTKIDAQASQIYSSWRKTYNDKNFYSNFNVLNNRVQTKQFITNVVPDYVNIEYSVVIQTYYMDQLNKIVEAINYASDSYWGNPERFKFKATIDNFQTSVALNEGQERAVKSSFTINMYGYIIPDTIQKDLNSVKKYNEKSKIIFSMETTSNPEIFMSDPQTAPDGRSRMNDNIATRKRISTDE
tara:strand:- start:550 stop:1527 length:978 start_codon:yes stop_codon:yes gene_type:complete